MKILLITKFIEFLKQMDGICYLDFMDNIEKVLEKSYDLVICDYELYSKSNVENYININCEKPKIWIYCTIEQLELINNELDDFILRPSSTAIIIKKLDLIEYKITNKVDRTSMKQTFIHGFFAHLLTKLSFNNKDKNQELTIKIIINIWHLLLIFDYKFYSTDDIKQLIDRLKQDCIVESSILDYSSKDLFNLIITILCLCPNKLKITNEFVEITPKITNEILLNHWKKMYKIDNDDIKTTVYYV